MKNIIVILSACCFFLSHSLLAQSADEKEIASRVESFRTAMLAADTKTLDRLTASQLSYAHSTGVVQNKTEFLDAFVKGTAIFLSIRISDQTISISDDVAVVRHRMVANIKNNKGPLTVDLVALLIWQKQNGEWKLLARQGAKIPPAQ